MFTFTDLQFIHGMTMMTFCRQQLPPPCCRYTVLRQCNYINLHVYMFANCCVLTYTPVDIRGLQTTFRQDISLFRILSKSVFTLSIRYLQHGGVFNVYDVIAPRV